MQTSFNSFTDQYGPASAFFGPQSSLQSGLSTHGTDPNSPDAFRTNMQIAQEQVIRVQNLARSTLAGMEHAYHPGINPLQTSADLSALKDALALLVDFLRQSGVGGLPLLPHDPSNPTTEEQFIAETARSVQALYERQKSLQDSSAAVTSLLSVADQTARR